MIAEVFEVRFWEQPPEAYQGKLPFVVTNLIAELNNRHAERVEGIFRLNGSDSKTKGLIEMIDHGPISDWSQFDDIHTISTALKRFFRQLSKQEPLVPFRYYDQCLDAAKCSVEESIPKLIQITKKLDHGRYILLSYLLRFLNFISNYSTVNLMNAKNLAVCFGPNIICSDKPESPTAMQQSLLSNSALETMIEHYEKIFDPKELTEDLMCTPEDIKAFSVPPLKWSHVVHLIARNKLRTQFGTIPYIPQPNMHVGMALQRPKHAPPPISDTDEVVQSQPSFVEETHNKSMKGFKLGEDDVFIPPPSATVKRSAKKSTRPPTRPKRNETEE